MQGTPRRAVLFRRGGGAFATRPVSRLAPAPLHSSTANNGLVQCQPALFCRFVLFLSHIINSPYSPSTCHRHRVVAVMSWLQIAPDSPFSTANIPFGIISTSSDSARRAAVAIGDYALDLKAFAASGGFKPSSEISKQEAVFSQPVLNDFAALGRPFHRAVREYLQDVFSKDTKNPSLLKDNAKLRDEALIPLRDVSNHLPMKIGDYTDFYASTNHAYNVGVLFRGPANALQPNYKHLPVAYHGRASSVVVSGTPIRRPWGQILKDPKAEPKVPVLAPCEKLDLELEMGMLVCRPNEMGAPVSVNEAEQHIFGYVLMNDWSARDLQAWEYVPLGPFTSKNLGTSISPWVVLADAAIPRAEGLPNENTLLPYLKENAKENMLDITLEVDLKSKFPRSSTIEKSSSAYIYQPHLGPQRPSQRPTPRTSCGHGSR